MDILYLNMLHNNGNTDKKFQLSVFYGSQVKHVFPQNGHTDNSKYRVISLLIKNNTIFIIIIIYLV